jgi:hypothetical protein
MTRIRFYTLQPNGKVTFVFSDDSPTAISVPAVGDLVTWSLRKGRLQGGHVERIERIYEIERIYGQRTLDEIAVVIREEDFIGGVA